MAPTTINIIVDDVGRKNLRPPTTRVKFSTIFVIENWEIMTGGEERHVGTQIRTEKKGLRTLEALWKLRCFLLFHLASLYLWISASGWGDLMKLLSTSWLNLWENFRKNLMKFQQNFLEWMLQNFKENFEGILNKPWMKFIGNLK